MSSTLGPQHYLYLGYLNRRRQWLSYLADSFQRSAVSTWTKPSWLVVDQSLSTVINNSRVLKQALDDRPIDSFLASQAADLEKVESEFFEATLKLGALDWKEALGETSNLWARELAQECIVDPEISGLTRGYQSLRGLFEGYLHWFRGGNFRGKTFLVRRSTPAEFEYEIHHCPHTYMSESGQKLAADLACDLEAKAFRAFGRTFLPSLSLDRSRHDGYCLDRVRILS